MSKVLITGGTGFLGTNLGLYLKKEGHDVHAYDTQTATKNAELLRREEIKVVRGDLDDIGKFLAEQSIDLIYHFAAQTAVTKSLESPQADFRINAEGSFKVAIESQRRDIPVIYASTNKVYGENTNEIPTQELETRFDFTGLLCGKGIPESFSIDAAKHSPYGISKLIGDLWIREVGGVANRFSCMYGINQWGTEDQAWVAHFIRSKIEGKPTTIYGTGKQLRDILYVDDVVELLAMQGAGICAGDDIRGQAFNIGGGPANTISVKELCDKLELKPSYKEERASDQRVFYCDITKAREYFGWEPKVSVDEGIERLLRWSQATF